MAERQPSLLAQLPAVQYAKGADWIIAPQFVTLPEIYYRYHL